MKKKFVTFVLAFTCVIACAFGLVACNNGDGADENQNTVEQKMAEQEWQACMATFAAGKNFSLTLKTGETVVGAVKMQGDTYYDNGGAERILTKNGAAYTKYSKNGTAADWSKTSSNETEYNTIVNSGMYTLVVGGAQAFAANYSSFNFDNGKYTAETISAGTDFTLKDITVTVASGNVSKIECTQAGATAAEDTKVVIDSVGSTTITVPQLPTVYEVDEDQWYGNMVNARKRNFTMVWTYTKTGKVTTYRSDGTSISTETDGKITTVYTKDGTEYFKYTLSENGWEKSSVTKTNYEDMFAYAADYLNLFKNTYSSFTYADNKYTCQAYDSWCTDAEAVFNDGNLVSFSFKGAGNFNGYTYLYKNFDTTTVEVPKV